MKAGESRTYTVPLRKACLKTPSWRRSKKAVNALRIFLLKHSKADDVKIGRWVNELIWERGIRSPPANVTVKVELKEEEIKKGKDKIKIKVAYADLAVLPTKAKKEEDKNAKKKGLLEKLKEKVEAKDEKVEEKAALKCEYCDEEFDSKKALKMHQQDAHKDELQKKKQGQVTMQQEIQMQK